MSETPTNHTQTKTAIICFGKRTGGQNAQDDHVDACHADDGRRGREHQQKADDEPYERQQHDAATGFHDFRQHRSATTRHDDVAGTLVLCRQC